MKELVNRDPPLTFRQNVIKSVFRFVSAGDSCLIVGIGSVGKSNLLRFIQNEKIRHTYLEDTINDFLFVYIDINKALERSAWGLFELMLHQILTALSSRIEDERILRTIDELHQRTTEPQTRYLALRFVDRAIHLVCHQLNLNLVFLVDEFDTLCQELAPADFSALRALRDDNKYRLMYVIASRSELHRLRENPRDIEAFEELVSPNTVWLGPYSKADANFMLQRLNTRYNVTLDEKVSHDLLVATGGHPGLLRAAHRIAIDQPIHLLATLLSSSQILDECGRIWHSLSHKEQRILAYLAMRRTLDENQKRVLDKLHHKGLIGGPWTTKNAIFSTLFTEYVKSHSAAEDEDIHVDRDQRLVRVEGREIEGLSPLEFGLIEYLEARRGQVCSRDELAKHLYPDEMAYEGNGITDNRLGAVVGRARKQIEPDPENPRYILTVRGHGYKFVENPENPM